MEQMANKTIPFYYTPRPYQQKAWGRRLSGKYDYYFKLWHRQCITLDTKIATPNGNVALRELDVDSEVFSYNEKDNVIITSTIQDIWEREDDCPILRIEGEAGSIGVSYDHPIFFNGMFRPAYVCYWRAMDADSKRRLAILCERYGKSIDPERIRSCWGDDEAAYACALWESKELPSGSFVCGRWNEGQTEGSSSRGRSLYPKSNKLATSESLGSQSVEQHRVESRMVRRSQEHPVGIIFDGGSSAGDSRCLFTGGWNRWDACGDILPTTCKEDRDGSRQHQMDSLLGHVEVCASERVYDIRVRRTHNFLVELDGVYYIYANCGKDADDLFYAGANAYMNPSRQTAYVGLDNKWIRRNIWDKVINGHYFYDSFPKDETFPNTTQQQLKFSNKDGLAQSMIQFIGFKESESLIGSSYDSFYVSELSLYKRGQFDFLQPIWDNKIAQGEPLSVNFNFTPRGLSNIAADMLRVYTGEDDPALWPGEHGRVYVDVLPADKSGIYTEQQLEEIRQRYIRAHGNDNMFRQEYMCEFLAVNAGLVYPAVEFVRKENRYERFALDTSKPVYVAWDISSKDKQSDWTAAIVYQYINNHMMIFDYFEDNRMAVVECVQELAKRPYFHLIREAYLPWDSDRSGSRWSPLEECRQQFPNIRWRKLERTFVADGINRVRQLMPNMIINSERCDWVIECLENYEYRELSSLDDWAATPKHDRYSHICDALRYCADALDQFPYTKTDIGAPKPMPSHYGTWQEDEGDPWLDLPPGMRPSKFSPERKKKPPTSW